MSMLLELYGTPAPIATQYPTRQHPDCIAPRKQVQCPHCYEWSDLTHNSYCYTGAIWLVELPAPAVVATPEPVAVEETAQVQTVEQVAAGIEHYKSVIAEWDDEFDAPYQKPNEELSAETKELIAGDTTPLNLDEPLALEVRPSWMQPENATEAVSEPVKTSMVVAGTTETCFRLMSTMDRPEYGLTADQVFYLVHSKSESTKASQPVYHIVTWDYELKRWICPCGDPHRICAHTKPVNQDCRDRAKQQQEAA